MEKKYKRSNTYRTEFIKKNPGFHGLYMCVYCGKIISQDNMEVDHVVAVNRANNSFFSRLFLGGNDVNDTINLVPSCSKCNRRKSNKGGVWIFKGKIGKRVQPALWVLFLVFCVFYSYLFLSQEWYLYVFNLFRMQ